MAASDHVAYEWDGTTDAIAWLDRPTAARQLASSDLPKSGGAFADRLEPGAAAERLAVVQRALSDGGAFRLEYRFGQGDTAIWIEESGRAMALPDGGWRVVGALRAATERRKREARLLYLACYDETTGYLTRPRLREVLSEAISRARQEGRPAAFLLVGVDNLRLINQAYGFEVADEVVVRIAERIERCLPGGVAGRFSDSKYGIVLEDTDVAAMTVIAERLMKVVREAVIETEFGPVAASVSVGCVPLPAAARTSRMAMRRAQEALEQSRNGGGQDSMVVYRISPDQDRTRRRDSEMARLVVSALNERRLILAYQPIVAASSLAPIEYECLLRLRQPDGTLLTAGEFIPTVEKLGLVRLIDQRALELAFQTFERFPAVRLSLNVSALTATDPNWLDALLRLLRGRAEIAQRLTVEITETMAIHDLAESARFVATLRELGCRVAIDDFGAGYTSFRHLKSLAVDMLKIDGSFVRGLIDDADNQLFVRALVDLARNFGITTVAESVGSAAEADLLRAFGVELFQGFYFGRPDIVPPWLSGTVTDAGAGSAAD